MRSVPVLLWTFNDVLEYYIENGTFFGYARYNESYEGFHHGYRIIIKKICIKSVIKSRIFLVIGLSDYWFV